MSDWLETRSSQSSFISSSELELRIMSGIILVFLVMALVVASVWLFVIEPRGKIHDRIKPWLAGQCPAPGGILLAP
jgi:hypothetical protein